MLRSHILSSHLQYQIFLHKPGIQEIKSEKRAVLNIAFRKFINEELITAVSICLRADIKIAAVIGE